MIWRSFGRGFAALISGYLTALFLDQLWPLGAKNGLILVILFILVTAWWGSSRSGGASQGALQATLTVLIPAMAWTFLYNLMQYEWGGPGVFNMDHLYYSLFLLVPPLVVGAAVGAVVGLRNAKQELLAKR